MPYNYFVEIKDAIIPVPDIERAHYVRKDEDDAPQSRLVIWMKPIGSATPAKWEFYGDDADRGMTTLRNVHLPAFNEPWRLAVPSLKNPELAKMYDQALHQRRQERRALAADDPDHCLATHDGWHEWSDSAKNTTISCKACGKIQP